MSLLINQLPSLKWIVLMGTHMHDDQADALASLQPLRPTYDNAEHDNGGRYNGSDIKEERKIHLREHASLTHLEGTFSDASLWRYW
jgi:hypothetical protein